MSSTSTCVLPARTSTSSTAARWRNTAYTTSRVWSARFRPKADKLKVQASDLIYGKQLHIDADLVVLAAAIEPDKSARPLATMLTASMDTNDFFTEAHPKLRPVESPTAGVFLSGTCQGPKDIPETVAQAGAAASKVIGLLCKDKLTGNPCVAHSDEMMCNGCSTCEKVCPYGAISYVEKEFRMPDRTTKVRRVAVGQRGGLPGLRCLHGCLHVGGYGPARASRINRLWRR